MADIYRICNYEDLKMPIGWSSDGFYQRGPAWSQHVKYGTGGNTFTGKGWMGIDTKVTMNGSNASFCINVSRDRDSIGNIRWYYYRTDDYSISKYFPYDFQSNTEVLDPSGKTWIPNHYNRYVYWIRPPAEWYNQDGQSEFKDTLLDQYGERTGNHSGYIKPAYCIHDGEPHKPYPNRSFTGTPFVDDKGQYHAGPHPYHYLAPMLPGKWSQVIMDHQMSHEKSSRSIYTTTVSHPYQDSPNNPTYSEGSTDTNYWDCSYDLYHEYTGNNSINGFMPVGSKVYIDSALYYREEDLNDYAATQHIGTLIGSYGEEWGEGTNGEVHVGFCLPRGEPYGVELRWSWYDLATTGGWDSANQFVQDHCSGVLTVLPGYAPGLMPKSGTSSTTSIGRHFWTEEIDPTQSVDGCVYIFLRAKQDEVPNPNPLWVRAICIPLTDGDKPPHLRP